MWVRWIFSICFLNACLCNPEVKTSLGKILGHVKTSFNGRKFAAFEGIPYAKPPVGDLRFEEAQPVEPWKGVLNANVTYTCMQRMGSIIGQEDCLYAYVYVPLKKLDPSNKLNVIVHIHGGAFMLGSPNSFIDPDMLMDHDVIFVLFNYRLGPLGFLSSGDDALPENVGMKDQVLALKWIGEHIQNFGGNSDKITLTGLSAGGASVHLHYFSPLSRHLFHRGVSESGVAYNPWVLQNNPREKFKKLADLVGCDNHDSKLIVNCLKCKPVESFYSVLSNFYEKDTFPFSPFAPVVETGSRPNKFLTKHPIQSYIDKDVLDVPWLLSTTSEEGIYPGFHLLDYLDDLDELWPKLAPYVLDYNYTMPKSEWEISANKIKEHYIGKGKQISKDNFQTFLRALSDRHFVNDAQDAAVRQAKVNKFPVYYFVFNHKTDALIDFFKIKGCAHGTSTKFFHGSRRDKYSEKDLKLIPIMVDMMVEFANTGNPKIKGISNWEKVHGDVITYINITEYDDIKQETSNELSEKEFWNGLNIMENEKLIGIKDEL
ncbi:unnamed protein product [Brassicogethes aeneus]|uniref:Carboxylic ester hydrolase n=1 Tax=Brassicogethes aeneus TaxID=1431903 RepID=A0A9P0FEG8_BRAAE|nr:unnamed protein product [Brassicogethes aeneus]